MKIQLREFDVLKSTNETAVAMAREGAPEGTVIVAARQEGGHGRMQRVWSSPLGGLWFRIITQEVALFFLFIYSIKLSPDNRCFLHQLPGFFVTSFP